MKPGNKWPGAIFDAAEKKIAEAEAIDIKWGLFDDTPTKVRNDLNKERPKNRCHREQAASVVAP